jgi:hypothetical protein
VASETIVKLRQAAQEQSWALRFSIAQPRPGWIERAACRGTNLDVWYPDERVRANHPTLAICRGCPVRLDCGADNWAHEHIVDRQLIHGIRAGFSAKARWRQLGYVNRLDTTQPAQAARVVA